MANSLRFSQLSEARQALVRLCQAINYGQIQHLEFRDAEPVLLPSALIFAELKLDSGDELRTELQLADFDLACEVCRLFERLDILGNGSMERIEVRAGIPRRILFRITL